MRHLPSLVTWWSWQGQRRTEALRVRRARPRGKTLSSQPDSQTQARDQRGLLDKKRSWRTAGFSWCQGEVETKRRETKQRDFKDASSFFLLVTPHFRLCNSTPPSGDSASTEPVPDLSYSNGSRTLLSLGFFLGGIV